MCAGLLYDDTDYLIPVIIFHLAIFQQTLFLIYGVKVMINDHYGHLCCEVSALLYASGTAFFTAIGIIYDFYMIFFGGCIYGNLGGFVDQFACVLLIYIPMVIMSKISLSF